MSKKIIFYKQAENSDCGPTCIKIIAKFYGVNHSLSYLKRISYIDHRGMSIKGLSDIAEEIGFNSIGVKLTLDGTEDEAGLLDVPLPCIALWKQRHFLVIYKITRKKVWIADPAMGKRILKRHVFERDWIVRNNKGIALILEPSPRFYDIDSTHETNNLLKLYKYLLPHKKLVLQLIGGLFLGSIFSFIFPFLTQAIVDVGIGNKDISFLYLILLAQLVLFVSSTTVGVIRSWIFLHIGIRINVSLIHNFLTKLTNLPINFFNRRMIGDLLQRIGDHQRINSFITGGTLSAIFSLFNLIVFSLVLFVYNSTLFTIYWFLTLIYFLWIFLFLKKRKEIDYQKFEVVAKNQSKLIEIIQGIQELKLQNSEKKRRWQWANIQAELYKVSIKALTISQFQSTGSSFINELKNILLSFFTAKSVIEGDITLGMMLAIQYIIGQINAPVSSMVSFIQNAQDANISFNRLEDIHNHENEEVDPENKHANIPEEGDLCIENLSFRYSSENDYVLKNINLIIPRNKVTAIVGTSGSGKTTLIKLLLRFYSSYTGTIKIGTIDLKNIRISSWRAICGSVLQDGYVFPDTIAHNIAESDDYPDNNKLYQAATIANIDNYINSLPAGYNTVIGEKGMKISQGEKQRLFIARAIYKAPDIMMFDEATNALDTENEKIIMNNMNQYYKGRTVIIVAHRLSTVKSADQIVVLEKGEIVEIGNHEELVRKKSHYYKLVSNQLELAK